MNFFEPFQIAFQLIYNFDPETYSIIFLSLKVSLTALLFASLIGIPIGATLASFEFKGKNFCILFFNTLLSMPPVVLGLLVYILISQSGPFGFLDLLYTPKAMMLAQFLLILPLSIALSREIFHELHKEYDPLFTSLRIMPIKKITTLIYDARITLITIILTCFGRAISEVGAVILVGGNIKNFTRVMTTAIALETSQGDLILAIALGTILLLTALIINILSFIVKNHFEGNKIL